MNSLGRRGSFLAKSFTPLLNLQILNIRHNHVSTEGSELPKCGSSRKVPLPNVVRNILKKTKDEAEFSDPEDFVFSRTESRGKPLTENFFRYGLAKCLKAIGIPPSDQKARNLTFHGLRHTFVTLGRMAGLSDIVIQALAGHKSAQMMEHYSHAGQIIDFVVARESHEKSLDITRDSIHG